MPDDAPLSQEDKNFIALAELFDRRHRVRKPKRKAKNTQPPAPGGTDDSARSD